MILLCVFRARVGGCQAALAQLCLRSWCWRWLPTTPREASASACASSLRVCCGLRRCCHPTHRLPSESKYRIAQFPASDVARRWIHFLIQQQCGEWLAGKTVRHSAAVTVANLCIICRFFSNSKYIQVMSRRTRICDVIWHELAASIHKLIHWRVFRAIWLGWGSTIRRRDVGRITPQGRPEYAPDDVPMLDPGEHKRCFPTTPPDSRRGGRLPSLLVCQPCRRELTPKGRKRVAGWLARRQAEVGGAAAQALQQWPTGKFENFHPRAWAGLGTRWGSESLCAVCGVVVCPWLRCGSRGWLASNRRSGAAPAYLQQAIGNRLVQATTPGPLAKCRALWPDGASFHSTVVPYQSRSSRG